VGRLRFGSHGLGWFALAFFLPVSVMATAIALYAGLGGEIGPARVGLWTLPALVGWISLRTFAGGGLGEELGWRGFALPRLQSRFSPVTATVVVGGAWTLWHLPLVIASAQPLTQAGVLLLFIAPMAFVYTWVFNGTGGSVLVPVLLHGTQNGVSAFLERSLLPTLASADGWVLLRILILLGVAAAAWIAVRRQGRRGIPAGAVDAV